VNAGWVLQVRLLITIGDRKMLFDQFASFAAETYPDNEENQENEGQDS